MSAAAIALFCLLSGGNCIYVPDTHVTQYAPGLGGINCQEPCNLTAWMEPVEYGVTVACGPSVPYGTDVYVDGWGWFECRDRGGAIDDDEIDISVPVDEFSWWSGDVGVVWVYE